MRSWFAAVLLALAAAPAFAAWQEGGVRISPLTAQYESMSTSRMVADGAGGTYVTWISSFQYPGVDGQGEKLVAQQVDILGNRPAPWLEAGKTIVSWNTAASFGLWGLHPIGFFSDGAGGALHAHVHNSATVEPHSSFNVFRVLPDGTTPGFPNYGGDFFGDFAYGASADGDGVGGFVAIVSLMTFSQPPNPRPASPTIAKRVDATGTPVWGPVDIGEPGEIAPAAALYDGAGGAFLAFYKLGTYPESDLYLLHLDGNGAVAPGWPAEGVLVCDASGTAFDVKLARDGAGGVFVAWEDNRTGVERIYLHHVLAAGTPAPGIPDDGQQVPSSQDRDTFIGFASDGQGGCYLTRSSRIGFTQFFGVLHRLDAALQPRAGWPAEGLVLNPAPYYGGAGDLAIDDLGGVFVISGHGPPGSLGAGTYVQHLAADGTPAPGWTSNGFLLSSTAGGAVLARSGTGVIAAWSDYRAGAEGIYAQRMVTDGPVAANMALLSGAFAAGRISLHWFGADGAGLRFTIERSTDGAWSPLAEIAADGTGHVRYEDTAVEAGMRYGYRLAWNEDGERHTTIAAYVDVPAGVSLAIESPRPNPSNREVSLAVSLPSAQPAKLEVLDLAGRRVATRDLTGLGAGRHAVALREVESLAAGLYLVQLHQAGEIRRARLVRVN